MVVKSDLPVKMYCQLYLIHCLQLSLKKQQQKNESYLIIKKLRLCKAYRKCSKTLYTLKQNAGYVIYLFIVFLEKPLWRNVGYENTFPQ